MATIFYFADLVDRLGVSEENLQLPKEVSTVGALLGWLKARGPEWQEALAESKVSVSVNKQFATPDVQIGPGSEIAFIPLRN